MQIVELAAGLFLLLGGINTGMLRSGDHALLINCCDTVTPERLSAAGVNRVDLVLCTQYHRSSLAGAYTFAERGARIVVPAAERHIIEHPETFWNDWCFRWHSYRSRPGPEVPARGLPVSRAVREGDIIEWKGHRIRVLDTPGASDGAVSYIIETGGKTFCFSGDAVYGPGQVWDLSALQRGYGFGIEDYHGFLGGRLQLAPSLEKLAACGADALVPSHGAVITDPAGACRLLRQRLDDAYRNYASINALNHWFPEMFADTTGDPNRMAMSPKGKLPDFIRHIPQTTMVLLSESGAAFVMDCGDDMVVEELRKMMAQKEITGVEAAWVTHYHDDHVDGLGRLHKAFGCPVIAEEHQADILTHPERYFLPCLSDRPVPVHRIARHGESWKWREFTLTAFHFPGQTLYHSALLVEGRGKRILFTGDSFSPSGIDDYCAGNRNFLGKGAGYDFCLDLVSEVHPDLIINAHLPFTMTLSGAQIEHIRMTLSERERLFSAMLPREHPNFGTDTGWVRAYPYESSVFRGGSVTIEIRFTNHGSSPATAGAAPVVPEGWTENRTGGPNDAMIAPKRDGAVPFTLQVPRHAMPGRYIIPVRVTWNGGYLGQIRHAVVWVM